MWIFTTGGFYSVVRHRDDPNVMVVRARLRDDLDRLRARCPALGPTHENHQADYRYRAFVARLDFIEALVEEVHDIDYPNFKSAVAARRGWPRERLYAQVWGVMARAEEALHPVTGDLADRFVSAAAPRSPRRRTHARRRRRR